MCFLLAFLAVLSDFYDTSCRCSLQAFVRRAVRRYSFWRFAVDTLDLLRLILRGNADIILKNSSAVERQFRLVMLRY
jgi:hypothetical protein